MFPRDINSAYSIVGISALVKYIPVAPKIPNEEKKLPDAALPYADVCRP